MVGIFGRIGICDERVFLMEIMMLLDASCLIQHFSSKAIFHMILSDVLPYFTF